MKDLKEQLSGVLLKQIKKLEKKSRNCKPNQLCAINQEIRKTITLLAAVKR